MADNTVDIGSILRAAQNPNTASALNIAQDRGNAAAVQNQVLQDRAILSPLDFMNKYGQPVTDALATIDLNRSSLQNLQNTASDPGNLIGDNALAVGTGLLNSLGGVATLGSRLAGPTAAQAVAKTLEEDINYLNRGQSPELKAAQRINAVSTELDKQDNNTQFQKDVKTDGEFIANLKSFGRDAADAMVRIYEQPKIAAQGVAEGVGSIAASAPTAGLINGLARVGRSVLGREAVERGGNVALSIGLQEGGGAYAQSSKQVLDMSHEDLLRGSDEYRTLINSGVSQDEAKSIVADNAGLQAASIQGPLAVVTGKLVEKFEGNPFGSRGAVDILKNVGREGVEEAVQNVTGQTAQNIAIQQNADDTQRIGEGLGSSAVEGALYGIGGAGVIQAPGGALKAASGALQLGKSGVDAVRDRGSRINEATENAAQNSEASVTQAINVATEQAPIVAEALSNLAQNEAPSDVPSTPVTDYISRVTNAVNLSANDLVNIPRNQLERMVTDNGGERPNLMTAMVSMARVARDENQTPEDRAQAALFVADKIRQNEQLFEEDLPSFLQNVDHSNEDYQTFDMFSKIVSSLKTIPAIKSALNEINNPNLVTENSAPETVALQAIHAPQAVNPDVAEKVIFQTENGGNQLSPEQLAVIKGSVALNRAAQAYDQETGEAPVKGERLSDIVSRQINTDGGNQPWQRSMEGHVRAINDAAIQGNAPAQQTAMVALQMFAQGMANKVAALNQSLIEGRKVTYASAGPDNRWLPNDKRYSVIVHPNNQKSVEFARQVAAEAKAVAQLSNNMAEIYPQFEIPTVEVPVFSLANEQEVSNRPEGSRSLKDMGETSVQENTNVEPKAEPTKDTVRNEAERKVERTPDIEQTNSGIETQRTHAEIIEDSLSKLASANEGTGSNQFTKAYTVTDKSRITALTNPINEVRDMLSTPKVLAEFMGGSPRYDLTSDNLNALDEILSLGTLVMREMNKRLSSNYGDAKLDKQATALKKAFNEGKPVNRWKTGKIFNIFDRVGQDGFRYNKVLAQTAIMAGLAHSLSADKQKGKFDTESAAEIVGITMDKVTPELVEQLNRGLSVSDFKRSLADKITDYWGTRPNPKTSLSLTRGIAEATAIEVMHGLQAAGLISLGSVEYHDGDVNFTQNRVYFDGRDEALVKEIGKLGAAVRLLDDVALVDGTPALGAHIGEPSKTAPKTQLRSPMVQNTRQQQEALLNESQTPYYPNKVMHSFMQRFGLENFIRFMGGQRYEADTLNINHERSLEGKNRTLEYSYNAVMNHMAEVQAYADKAGVDVGEMPTYYDFNMSKVGRMQMQGNNNPQSDKLAREVFMPTRTILDMTDTAKQNQFWMTVAQGIGIKTEKVRRADAVTQAQEITLNGKYRDIIDQLVEWLPNQGDLPEQLADDIIDAMGSDASMHGLHGLLSVAQYVRAVASGADLTKYEHFNYLEADGKTNGPIMTTALFASRINGDIIRVLRKGGIFLGEEGRSLNSHILERDGEDLYQSTTTATSEFQNQFRERYKDDDKVINRLNTLQRVMSALDANIELDEDGVTLKLKRGVTKNPLTISIYGSGIDGIAAKVANGLLEEVYAMLSNGNVDRQTYEGFDADISELMSEVMSLDSRSGEIKFGSLKGSTKSEAGSFSPAQFNAFKSHIRVLFVNQMHQGINDQILRHVAPSTQALQKATNLQSVFLTGAFRQAIVDKMLELRERPDYHAGDFLSEADLQQIYRDLRPLSPIINTGSQNFFIAGSQKADIMPTVTVNGQKIVMPDSFAVGIDDTLSSAPYVFQPDVAGVKGVPSLVIGTGDGMIMQDASIQKDAPKGTLKVFDGINLPANTIDSASEKVNHSVYRAMTANPMKAVAESFNTFLANDPVEQLLGDQAIEEVRTFVLTEVTKAVTGTRNPKELLSIDEARQALVSLGSELNELALETEARNIVFNELSMSVDQMASAESPYSKSGSLPTSLDADEMADIFNTRFEQVLAALKEGKKNAPSIEDGSDNGMLDTLEDTTTPDESGARIATIPSLQVWLQNRATGLSTDQKDLLGTALTSLKDSGYRILFGSRDQLNEYEGNNYPEYFMDNGYLGKIIPEIRHMYISNVTGETLLHELVHAATLDKVIGYYDNPDVLSEADRGAVERIEGLMGEWLTQSTEADSEALNTARLAATNQVAGYIQSGQQALAVNEFMAWVLSNQELMKGAKKTAVRNPLFRVIGDALSALKTLIWGKRGPSVNEDMLSNLRFNTRILMKTPTPTELLRKDMRKVALFHNPTFGNDTRLAEIRNRFASKITEYITDPTDPIGQTSRNLDLVAADLAAEDQLASFVSGIFGMSRQEHSTFAAIHTAMAIATKLDSNALSRVQDIYTHVIDNLKVENLMRDPNANNPNDRWQAQQKFDVITGAYAAKIDKLGRSDRLPTFLALAQTSKEFRDYLYNVKPPKAERNMEGTLDAALENFGDRAMDALGRAISGDLKAQNVRDAIDTLSLRMSEVVTEDKTFIEQYSVDGFDKADAFIKDNINKLSDAVRVKANDVLANTSNPYVAGAARLIRFGATLVNETTSEQAISGITQALNQGDGLLTLREIVNEIVGRTKENASVFDMISEVRAAIQQTRQQFRDGLPEILNNKFSVPLSDQQKSDLFMGLGRTDAASLYGLYGVQGTLDLIADNTARSSEISNLEKQIGDKVIFAKADQLAEYMVTGNHGVNLLRNARAIAHKFGEIGMQRQVSDDLVEQIDALVSLYAIDKMNLTSVNELIKNEKEGMNYLLSYMVGTRRDEVANITNNISAINNYKGYVPSTLQQGVSLIVASVGREAELYKQGYQYISEYVGSSADRAHTKMAYYYQPVSGRATYNQGVLQTVHQTVNGIQPNTGYTLDGIAGRVTEPTKVQAITRLLRNQKPTDENILPVYNENGQVVAYERAMSPRMGILLNRDTDLTKMIGVWKGRQIEEKLAQIYNEKLLDNLSEIWDEGKKAGRSNEFIDLSKSTDKIHQDTWNLIPNDVRDAIKTKFGRDGFPVRRDMINDAVGFRSASIGDMWTGDTRLDGSTAKFVADVATGIFGKDAYSKLVKAEKMVQKLVTEAKLLIVVKSVIVPIANSVANVYQLMARGMPLRNIGKSYAQKTAEINDYAKRRHEEVQLDADLAAAKGRNDLVSIRKLTNRIQAIQDSYKRMSIWPLIEAGEFSAITEGGVTNEELRISNFIDKLVDYIPDAARTPYRYAMITKDTPMFKAMAIATQYGDFIAKASMYDHLRSRGMSQDEALAQINEEFVNYNRLAGRVRNYTESTGFIWFWNFKLRSMKVAASLMRNNPARAFLMTFMPPALPVVGNVGTPISDNFLGSLLKGSLGNSIGWSLGLRAPTLNPWINLLK